MIAFVNGLHALNGYIGKGAWLLNFSETMGIQRHVGGRIAFFRERSGLSQKKLAVELRVSPATIFRLEKGHSWGEYTSLKAIADRLGVTVEDFFAGMEHKPIKPSPEEALNVLREALESQERRIRELERTPKEETSLSPIKRGFLDLLNGMNEDQAERYFLLVQGGLNAEARRTAKKSSESA